ncbi:N-6 DNA methylase [uncultured Chryseobacterium sp.]|uniref:N-6 DNA methylase n=1 Tax=uncultured Chryseobacterium sp. TaxID=259322 RepID=UPI0025E7C6AE|nr:N-6 DNA methylase [uncultured Chryseobacterium sp.]
MKREERNKRLGQYFTSTEVAKLLTELALSIKPDISNAIDPMMGKGIFLHAINSIKPDVKCYGIEVDLSLSDLIKKDFEYHSRLIFGNAFDNKTIGKLSSQFDLVITNPPYVRHLNQTKQTFLENGLIIPSGEQVRNGLYLSLHKNSKLNSEEQNILIEATKKYSGLSDLSVPSIIQCISLTKPNGVLALLIPESCITREYSITTLNILFKLFDVKIIIKDEGRNWFDDVQVKTLLIVGQKLKRPRKELLSHSDIPIIEIRDSNPKSPLGNSFKQESYKDFFSNLYNESIDNLNIYTKHYRSVKSFFINILSEKNMNTYSELKKFYSLQSETAFIDQRLKLLIKNTDLFRFENMSIKINQGLRTGANMFFYCDLIKEEKNQSLVSFRIKGETHELYVPNDVLKPVLRKQNEILSRNIILVKNLKGRLIDLNQKYTSSDIAKYNLSQRHQVLPPIFSNYIDYCSTLNIGTTENPKYIPQLSAVKTNVSNINDKIKTWYQIPELKDRHLPDICVPRVNTNKIKPLIIEKGVIVDANFITINVSPNSLINKYGILALLNSDWTSFQLEIIGNILGGGALKLDRNHLHNLLFSNNIYKYKKELEKFGKKLAEYPEDKEALLIINEIVNTSLDLNDGTDLKNNVLNRLKLRNKNA